jgi:hypothetical protein
MTAANHSNAHAKDIYYMLSHFLSPQFAVTTVHFNVKRKKAIGGD